MSNAAIKWALVQPVSKSSAKFVLVVMADLAGDEDMRCFPSAKHLTEATGQDVKTIQAGLRRLREEGFITDTGERRGATGQVIVYQLNTPEFGGLSAQPKTTVFPSKTPEFGGVETASKTPVFPAKPPVFPGKDPQISHERPPKTGDGHPNTPQYTKDTNKKRCAFDASAVALPDWLSRDCWSAWCRDRKARGKPITEEGAKAQLRKLDQYRDQGHDPASVIETSIANGWQGLFPPKSAPQLQRTTSGKHAGFQNLNYREGVSADGSLA